MTHDSLTDTVAGTICVIMTWLTVWHNGSHNLCHRDMTHWLTVADTINVIMTWLTNWHSGRHNLCHRDMTHWLTVADTICVIVTWLTDWHSGRHNLCHHDMTHWLTQWQAQSVSSWHDSLTQWQTQSVSSWHDSLTDTVAGTFCVIVTWLTDWHSGRHNLCHRNMTHWHSDRHSLCHCDMTHWLTQWQTQSVSWLTDTVADTICVIVTWLTDWHSGRHNLCHCDMTHWLTQWQTLCVMTHWHSGRHNLCHRDMTHWLTQWQAKSVSPWSLTIHVVCTLPTCVGNNCIPAYWELLSCVCCFTSLQQGSVSQGPICSDRCMRSHTETEVADQTYHLIQSQFTDTGPAGTSAEPMTPRRYTESNDGHSLLRHTWAEDKVLHTADCPVGLVVKASASGMAELGFKSGFRCGNFSRSARTGDLKLGTPVATLPGAWHFRVSPGTGWPASVYCGEVASLIGNFYLSVAARTLVWADPSLIHITSMLLGC